MSDLDQVAPTLIAAAERALTQFATALCEACAPAIAALRTTAASCVLVPDDDMEARAARFNRWHARAFPLPLRIDGHAYRRRQLARRRRRTT